MKHRVDRHVDRRCHRRKNPTAAAALHVLGMVGAALLLDDGAAGCAALSGTNIRDTTISSAQYITSPFGHYCEVAATVVPEHDVKVRLPDNWQHRYVQHGGSGFDGAVPDLSTGFGTVGRDPVGSGFVVAGSNGGHRSSDYPGASSAADRGLTLSYSVAKILRHGAGRQSVDAGLLLTGTSVSVFHRMLKGGKERLRCVELFRSL